MGRIQRKKSSAAKKKKKQSAVSRASTGRAVAGKSEKDLAASSAAVARAPVKKQAALPRKQAAAPSQPVAKPRDNIFTKTAQFLREVKVELKKVAWPSRKQTLGSTAVVIALVMLISLFLGMVDFGISSLIRIVLQ